MRLLHTSDWHLGRSFHRVGMLSHQAAYIDHLIEVVRSERVDTVVVAGDVYDRALPPVDAVAVLDEALARLAAEGATVLLTSGNHDSAGRLGFGGRLFERAGIHLRTRLDQVGDPVLVEDRHGLVACYGLPYLDPIGTADAWGCAPSHQSVLEQAMARVRQDLATRPPGTRSVVAAHAFVAGAAPSDSERDISVGGVARVPADVFAGVDYVALGHLHRAHQVSTEAFYSGSPLAYSFSEADHVKGSWLVDVDPDGTVSQQWVPAPTPRPLATLRGTLDDLLADPAHAALEDHWLAVVLTDPLRPPQAMARLRARFPHTLLLDFQPLRPPTPAIAPGHHGGRGEHAIALDFVATVRGVPATEHESRLLRQALDACCVVEASASPAAEVATS